MQITDRTVVPTANSGGIAFYQNQDFTRDTLKLDMSKFMGSHEIKLGGDYEMIDTVNNNFYSGGQLIYKFASGGVPYYRHRFYINDRSPGFDRDNPSTWQLAYPLTSEPRTRNASVYLQDSWKVARSFTLNLGVRWEQQDVQNRDEETAFKLNKNWAPRLGFVWDVTNNGKSKLYAHYGRFYENIPQDINIRAFGGELVCFCYNFDPSPGDIAARSGRRRARRLLLGGATPVDPDLKGQYIDEALGGFEYEVAPNFAARRPSSATATLGRVIEDFLIPSEGSYFIANPGEGTLGQSLGFYDGVTSAPAPEARAQELQPGAHRPEALQPTTGSSWPATCGASWKATTTALFQNSTGQLDPNINSAFDYADFLVNSQGRLSAERQHQLKLDGSYEVGGGALNGLNLGLSTYWYSGLPLNAYGYSFAYSNWEYYLAPRGSVGRGPSDYEMDVHLSYPIKVGERARINLIVDAFNLLNRQAITQLDERYNLDSDDPCAGVPGDLCNGDGGLLALPNSTTPVGSIPNPRSTATNPDYLKKGIQTTSATAGFTGQRSIRLGVRFTF